MTTQARAKTRGPFETKKQSDVAPMIPSPFGGVAAAGVACVARRRGRWSQRRALAASACCVALPRRSLRASMHLFEGIGGADSPAVARTVMAFSNIGKQQCSIQATLAKKCLIECWNR